MTRCCWPATLLFPVVLAGCGHEAAFTTPAQGGKTPYQPAEPTRLTFDAGADLHPLWTADGRALMYTFERQRPGAEFPDRCLGALPPDGGQRVGEWCWPGWDERSRRDGIEAGTFDTEGQLVFVHHYGSGSKQPNPFRGAVYRAPPDSLVGAERLLTLLAPPPGGTTRYDYLLGLVPTGPHEITGLASAVSIAERCIGCAFDTLYNGIDLVRLATDRPDDVRVLARIGGARHLAWDASVARFFFSRDGRVETVPQRGGEPQLVWQVPRSTDRSDPRVTGVAAGAGRVVVSYRWTEGGEVQSVIAELASDGNAVPIASAVAGPIWGELSLSPDGRRLVVERRAGSDRDLYLFEMP